MIANHQTERKLKCTVGSCTYSTLNIYELQKHRLTHLEKFTCKICYHEFDTRIKFANHYNLYHGRGKDYKCLVCDKLFCTQTSVRTHVLSVHKQKFKNEGMKYFKFMGDKEEKSNIQLNRRKAKTESEIKFLESQKCKL